MSAGIRFILLDLRQHPIEITRGYLATAEFANARGSNFERRAAVGAVQIRSRRRRFSLPAADERPVLTPTAQLVFRSGGHLAAGIDGVIVAFGPDAQGDRIVKSIFFDLHRLHRRYPAL